MGTSSLIRTCECGAVLRYSGRGRPPRRCGECKRRQKAEIAEKKRAYREANKAEIAEKQRAYYEANKAEIAEKKRAYYEANKAEIAEKKRAYREANKAEIAEKKRAYYEANKAEIAEKQRARAGLLCSACGEHMRHPSSSGLCGLCEAEMREAA
jgi:hypothetical protein